MTTGVASPLEPRSGRRSHFAVVLRDRRFFLIWVAQLVSEVGDAVATIAVLLLLTEKTSSPLAISLLMLCQLVPVVVAGPFVGLLVDRWDRQKLLVASDWARAALWLLLALRPGVETLYAVAGLSTLASVFFGPSRSAIIPEVVGREGLTPALALAESTTQTIGLFGPLLGGALAGLAGTRAVFAADAASFLVSGFLLAFLSLPRAARWGRVEVGPGTGAAGEGRGPGVGLWRGVGEGLAFLRRTDLVRFIVLFTAGFSGLMRFVAVAQIDYLRNVLRLDSGRFGLVMTLGAAGAIAGSVLVGNLGGRVRRGRALGWALWGAVAALVPVWFRPGYAPLLVLMTVTATLGAVYGILMNATFVGATPREVRGRVFTIYGSLTNVAGLAMLPLAGLAVRWFGSAATIGGIGAVALLATALALTATRGGRLLRGAD